MEEAVLAAGRYLTAWLEDGLIAGIERVEMAGKRRHEPPTAVPPPRHIAKRSFETKELDDENAFLCCGAGDVSRTAVAAPYSTPVPATFESRGEDRKAITALLDTYAKAVSTKDQALFETLLLDKTIPFSGVPLSGKGHDAIAQTSHYDDFRKGVFEGEPFIQTFRDIQIHQDGTLAQVSLVFENATATKKSWGWKTMELLKVDGRWKIAAEFFTGHR